WSADIRAEPRRQAGRQGSRWLREEGGGRQDYGGSERVVQPDNTPENSSRGPTIAELDPHSPNEVHNRS
ncbi:hypothetical protein A2U01_0113763, partial [Trifolium medium]|nr:hypothetical protein [Trifolium medium]